MYFYTEKGKLSIKVPKTVLSNNNILIYLSEQYRRIKCKRFYFYNDLQNKLSAPKINHNEQTGRTIVTRIHLIIIWQKSYFIEKNLKQLIQIILTPISTQTKEWALTNVFQNPPHWIIINFIPIYYFPIYFLTIFYWNITINIPQMFQSIAYSSRQSYSNSSRLRGTATTESNC